MVDEAEGKDGVAAELGDGVSTTAVSLALGTLAQNDGIAKKAEARLDPQSDGTARYFELLSEAHFDEGQCEAGLEWARKLVAARPDSAWGYVDRP